jgi:hypothetical protein
MTRKRKNWDIAFGALRGAKAAGDNSLYRETLVAITKGAPREQWHAIGWKVRAGADPVRQAIPPEYWDFLVLEPVSRTAKGAGVEYIKVEVHIGSATTAENDVLLSNIRQAYNRLERPSARAVAEAANYSRNSKGFKEGWARLMREKGKA